MNRRHVVRAVLVSLCFVLSCDRPTEPRTGGRAPLVNASGVIGAQSVTGTITRLSNGSVNDQQNMPTISGTNVVWTDPQTWANTIVWGSDAIGYDYGNVILWGTTGGLTAETTAWRDLGGGTKATAQ